MKRIIDDKGRFFGLISFIDIIALLVVVVLAAMVFVKFSRQDTSLTPANTVKVTFTYRISAVRLTTANHFRIGDSLYTDKDIYIGKIAGVSIEEATAVEPLVNGSYVVAKVYERYDVVLTVESQCSYSNGRYYADRVYELNANADQITRTKYVQCRGTIITITEG